MGLNLAMPADSNTLEDQSPQQCEAENSGNLDRFADCQIDSRLTAGEISMWENSDRLGSTARCRSETHMPVLWKQDCQATAQTESATSVLHRRRSNLCPGPPAGQQEPKSPLDIYPDQLKSKNQETIGN